MKGTKIVLSVARVIKPILLKVFPYDFLKKIKKKMIDESLKNLEKIKTEEFKREAFPDGINLIGNMKAQTGLGQSCRLIAAEVNQCGIPYSIFQYSNLGVMAEADYQFDGHLDESFPFNINLIHINPHELGLAFVQLHEMAWNYHYNIGFWLWELEEFPDEWIPCFDCVDEIWTPSEFASSSIRKKTSKPVVTIPYYLDVKLKGSYCRADFGLPEDKYLFLMMYDRTSTRERKNPRAVIDAYKQAFVNEENVGLVIKISNSTKEELEQIRSMLPGCKHVYFVTEILDRDQVNGLIHLVDAVVSLHRSEGFGLVMAESMFLGTPVIATNWSANTEFMTADTACLVDAKMVELKYDIGAFQKGNRWADADVNQAAGYMKKLFDDPDEGIRMAVRAKEYIRDRLSKERAVSLIRKRLEVIYGGYNERN